MKKIGKLTVITALMVAGTALTNAQTSLVQNVTISLSGFSSAKPVRFGTKDAITVLGGAKGSKLVEITAIGDTNNPSPSFIIRKKGTDDIDVTGNLSISLGDSVTFNKTDYSGNSSIAFTVTNITFNGQAFTTVKTRTVKKGSVSVDALNINADVIGNELVGGDIAAALKGKVVVTGGKLQ